MAELDIPQVPPALPDDIEDVSWALSTAEAMWARGDHAEGVKWLRKAAEAASDAELDGRALELAKVASDLAAAIADRPSRAAPAAPPPLPSAPPTKASSAPPPTPTSASGRPGALPAGRPNAAPQAPRAGGSLTPKAPAGPNAGPSPRPGPPSKAPRPLAPSVKPPAMAAEKKGRRRSRENLESAARAAGVLGTPESGPDTARELPENTTEVPAIAQLAARSSEPSAESIAGGGAAEWDRSPTQSLGGDELPSSDGDRMTSLGAPPPFARPQPRPASKTVHDEDIHTTQAVRVVVWRDASGVHVAPEGTVVSAITASAVLVALEPGADLTAWLSKRHR